MNVFKTISKAIINNTHTKRPAPTEKMQLPRLVHRSRRKERDLVVPSYRQSGTAPSCRPRTERSGSGHTPVVDRQLDRVRQAQNRIQELVNLEFS